MNRIKIHRKCGFSVLEIGEKQVLNAKPDLLGFILWGLESNRSLGDKELIPWIYRELLKLNSKKPKQSDSKRDRGLKTDISPMIHNRPISTLEEYLTSLISREMQIKTKVRYHLTPTSYYKNTYITISVGKNVEKLESLCTKYRKWYSPWG